MRISKEGIDLIKKFEGFRGRAYLCPAGVPTIGYGHTKGVKLGQKATIAQAEEFLKIDLMDSEKGVEKLVKVELTPGEFSALVSFAYNVGLGALKTSTLLKLLNAGKKAEAAEQFSHWKKAGGKVSPGLVKRRAAEKALFLRG